MLHILSLLLADRQKSSFPLRSSQVFSNSLIYTNTFLNSSLDNNNNNSSSAKAIIFELKGVKKSFKSLGSVRFFFSKDTLNWSKATVKTFIKISISVKCCFKLSIYQTEQISILECFLKDHVTVNCNTISQYYCFYCIFDQINADYTYAKILKNLTNPRILNGSVAKISTTLRNISQH